MTKLSVVNQVVSNSPSKIRPMVRVEYKGQANLPFVEAKPIAAGRAGRGALILPKAVFIAAVTTPPPFGHPLLSKRGS